MIFLKCENLAITMENAESSHVLIQGKTGMGKSFLMKRLIDLACVEGKKVVIFDLGEKWKDDDVQMFFRHNVCKDGITIDSALAIGKIAEAFDLKSRLSVGILQVAYERMLRRGQECNLCNLAENIDEESSQQAENISVKLRAFAREVNVTFDERKHDLRYSGNVFLDFGGLSENARNIAVWLTIREILDFQKADRMRIPVGVFIDEFQLLCVGHKNIVGTLLTEGRKYGLAVILATQFVKYKFSDAVRQQLEQTPHRFFFRLTFDEATVIARQLAGSAREREELTYILTHLERGEAIFYGKHRIGTCDRIVEKVRKVDVV